MPATNNKKRILFVITKANFGGAQQYVLELAAAAKTRGNEVAVAVGSEGTLTGRLEALGVQVFITAGLQRDISLLKEWRAFRSLLSVMREWRPEVVHINSSKAGVLGSLAARIARVPRIIFTAHGWPFFEDRSWLWRAMAWKLSWYTVLLSHRTICVSEYDRTHARFPLLKSKLVRIYNGVEKPYLFAREEARSLLFSFQEREAHRDDLHLVAIGELHPNKNLETLLYALAALKRTDSSMRFFLTLMGSGELEAHLQRMVRDRGLESRVHFAGFVNDPYNYLAAFDVLVMPSKKEGLPFTLLYGLAAGIPMIASRVGGIPEILTNAPHGQLIDPKRPATLMNALRNAYYERKEFGSALAPHELGEFARSRMLEHTLALYD